MRVKWKKLFWWTSLGSVAVAFAVSAARKANRVPAAPPEFEPVPPDCTGLTVRTEVFRLEENGAQLAAWDDYRMQLTSFKVWNVLELQPQPEGANPEGTVIYHVSRVRKWVPPGLREPEGELVERFYGTVRSIDPASGLPRKNQLARGAILEIARCYVGGASNGVETGEVHRSAAPVLDFAFDRSDDGTVTSGLPLS